MSIQIEKGVPAPVTNIKGPGKYPFAKMEVGDSFFVANDDTKDKYNSVLQSSSHHVRRHDTAKKFATRKVDGGVRCWRIA